MMTAEVAERYIEGPITYPELTSRVAAYVGEEMIQQSCAPVDIGEVELRGTRKPRRDESDASKRTREASLESAAVGKAREARSRQTAG